MASENLTLDGLRAEIEAERAAAAAKAKQRQIETMRAYRALLSKESLTASEQKRLRAIMATTGRTIEAVEADRDAILTAARLEREIAQAEARRQRMAETQAELARLDAERRALDKQIAQAQGAHLTAMYAYEQSYRAERELQELITENEDIFIGLASDLKSGRAGNAEGGAGDNVNESKSE